MITLVYGMPGMGKTLWLHDYVWAHPEHRFFVVDHAAEWGGDAPHWRSRPPSYLQVFEGAASLPDKWPDNGVFVFRGREPLEVAQLVLDVGNATYVDDEIDMTATRRGWDESPLRTIVHQGRHAENAQGEFTQVNILGACRRPQSLHTDLTDIVDQACIFRVQGSRTLERLRSDSMIEDTEWDAIRTLQKFRFRHWPSGDYVDMQPIGGDTSTQENAGQTVHEVSESHGQKTPLKNLVRVRLVE